MAIKIKEDNEISKSNSSMQNSIIKNTEKLMFSKNINFKNFNKAKIKNV